MEERIYTQVLIIGSGLSGCTAALTLADAGVDVLLLSSSKNIGGGNSELAQGGIVYKSSTQGAKNNDDATLLKQDIFVAGHNYNYNDAVEHLCTQGPVAVEQMLMQRLQVPFDKNSDESFHLTREGGHSTSRILHAADHTGKTMMQSLSAAVLEHPRITCMQDCFAIDILTSRHQGRHSDYRYHVENRCAGAYVFNVQKSQPQTILADWTILASGGVGNVFLHSTNTESCVGSAISMAHRAKVSVVNAEFMQFHPTALYSKKLHRRALITEAMRGEGARLLDAKGKPFMQRYDERGDLAPRDVVSQSMVSEMLSTGAACLYLDARHMEQDLSVRFPTVSKFCNDIGLNIRKNPIPVVPAAHYFCGGILVDKYGRTDVAGLYAIGECSCTGVHGANRLASTSLLEALTWGWCAGKDIAKRSVEESGISEGLRKAIPNWEPGGTEKNDDPALIAQDWASIRNTMWNYVGITRTNARLYRAFQDLRDLSRRIHDFYKRTQITPPLINLFHGVHTAYVITQAALRNKESRGCHYRVN